jgi:hypothetical protein
VGACHRASRPAGGRRRCGVAPPARGASHLTSKSARC